MAGARLYVVMAGARLYVMAGARLLVVGWRKIVCSYGWRKSAVSIRGKMIIKNANFIKSVAKASELYLSSSPEIAVVGRSNVGKSSFINMLAGQGKLARTSCTPGRTRLINYFNFNNGGFVLVDLPGYGYAQASKTEQGKWGELIEGYLQVSKNLRNVILLVDIRQVPSIQDIQMLDYLYFYNKSVTIVATKCDKIPKSKLPAFISTIATTLKVGIENIFPTSAETSFGKEKVLSRLEQFIKAGAEE
ncbi:MAG: ribosome biogenesis GTP-binding protein YihA/YsxC [Clostridia bacterium]